MSKLIVFGLLAFIASCGVDENSRSKKEPAKAVVNQNIQNPDGTVTVATTEVGDIPPVSYTFIDTPDANLCVDAFNRVGVTLPINTVARTLNVQNVRKGGISIQDLAQSTIPVLTIVRLNNQCSDTTFQFLNPLGFYCIVKNSAVFSNVTIQRNCASKMAQLEPTTITNYNSAPVAKKCLFGWFCGLGAQSDSDDTTTAYNSQIIETPCIP
jgi:hypothetical protein